VQVAGDAVVPGAARSPSRRCDSANSSAARRRSLTIAAKQNVVSAAKVM
jgi:hypothetical protein